MNVNERTVGMMGTMTGVFRIGRLLYIPITCGAVGRIDGEYKVVDDDCAEIVASSADEYGEERERDEENFNLIRDNEGFLNQLAARCVLTRSSWRA